MFREQRLIPQPAGRHGFLELQAMRDHSSGISHARMGESSRESEYECFSLAALLGPRIADLCNPRRDQICQR